MLKPWETQTPGKVRQFASEHRPLDEGDPRLPELRGQAPGNGKDNTPQSRKLM